MVLQTALLIGLVVFSVLAISVVFINNDVLNMSTLNQNSPPHPGPPESGTFGEVLWNVRTLDLVGQIAVIFAGVFAVLALFRKRNGKDE
jgi:hypothetical protein